MKRSTNAAPSRVERVAAAGSGRRRRSAGTARRGRSRRPRSARRRRGAPSSAQTPASTRSTSRVCPRSSTWVSGARGTRPRSAARPVSSSSRQRCAPPPGRRRGSGLRSRHGRGGHRAGAAVRAGSGQAAGGRRARGDGQHFVSVGGHQHRVLPLRRQRMVGGDDRPAVGEAADAGAAGVDHRLDGEDHPGQQLQSGARAAVVQRPAAPRGTAGRCRGRRTRGRRRSRWLSAKLWIVCADVAEMRAGPHRADAAPHRLVGGVDQPLRLDRRRARRRTSGWCRRGTRP